jgi:RecA-family ATPase
MTTAENRILDIRTVQRDRWETNGGDVYRYVTFDEISVDPPAKNWLIKGIFALGETSAWIGPPGSLKSALLAEASIAIAGGLAWHGHRNKRAMGVVYFALERADLVNRRLVAHREKLGLGSLPIVVCNAVLDLTKEDSWKKAVNTIRDVKTRLGAEIGAVIIDTHSKLVAAGGGDENSATDQNIIFANIARVKLNSGVHVALIGHTGKDESRGARGSNALLSRANACATFSGSSRDLVGMGCAFRLTNTPFNY